MTMVTFNFRVINTNSREVLGTCDTRDEADEMASECESHETQPEVTVQRNIDGDWVTVGPEHRSPDALRAEIVAAVESADVVFPESVCDKALDVADAGGDWKQVIADAVAVDSAAV